MQAFFHCLFIRFQLHRVLIKPLAMTNFELALEPKILESLSADQLGIWGDLIHRITEQVLGPVDQML